MVSTDLTTAAAITPYDYTQHTPDIAERLRCCTVARAQGGGALLLRISTS